jgi:hypothetical protein
MAVSRTLSDPTCRLAAGHAVPCHEPVAAAASRFCWRGTGRPARSVWQFRPLHANVAVRARVQWLNKLDELPDEFAPARLNTLVFENVFDPS